MDAAMYGMFTVMTWSYDVPGQCLVSQYVLFN